MSIKEILNSLIEGESYSAQLSVCEKGPTGPLEIISGTIKPRLNFMYVAEEEGPIIENKSYFFYQANKRIGELKLLKGDLYLVYKSGESIKIGPCSLQVTGNLKF